MRASTLSLLSACQHLVLNLSEAPRDSLAGTFQSIVISRLAGLLLTPAAGVDICAHGIAIPCALLYSAGRSVVRWNFDFSLPREHLQRVRQSVAPFFFAGLMSMLHPYAGIFFSEPANKHFMWGILLSGSSETIPVVCSPIKSMSEMQTILSYTHGMGEASADSINLCKAISSSAQGWEYSLEVLQSINFFDLKLSKKLSEKIVRSIDESVRLPDALKFIARRATVIAFVALAVLDYAVHTGASILCLAAGIIKSAGGDAPVYFEACSSPYLHLTNLVKAILYPLGVMIGALLYLIKPEYGSDLGAISSRSFGLLPLQLRLIELKLAMHLLFLRKNNFMVLPIIDQHGASSDDNLSFLPSQGSHMMYLLIQRTKNGFSLEMVERGGWKGTRKVSSIRETLAICREAFSLRFNLLRTPELAQKIQHQTFTGAPTIHLPEQKNVTNCVVTNLAATMVVANKLAGHGIDAKDALGILAKQVTEQRHGFMINDFYPFATPEQLKKFRPAGGDI